ncbi:MAG: inorganic diphosphatase [Streptococcaceae bacterium]|jgi:inorganic pyrophosphatase|nr:inorganic diphosphatase [Streptococcaceae bacterium]
MVMIKITIDRPIGSRHHDTVYPVNYGFVPDLIAADGEEQDVYVLSDLPENQQPLKEFTGRLVAIIHRRDDVENKWVVTTDRENFSAEEIMSRLNFMEKFFDSWIEMLSE